MPLIKLVIISLAITCILFGLLLIQLKAQLTRHEKVLNFLTSTHINGVKFTEYRPESSECPVKIVSVNNDNKQIHIAKDNFYKIVVSDDDEDDEDDEDDNAISFDFVCRNPPEDNVQMMFLENEIRELIKNPHNSVKTEDSDSGSEDSDSEDSESEDSSHFDAFKTDIDLGDEVVMVETTVEDSGEFFNDILMPELIIDDVMLQVDDVLTKLDEISIISNVAEKTIQELMTDDDDSITIVVKTKPLIDYRKLKVENLKMLVTNVGIDSSKMKKNELIKFLESSDM